MLYLFCINFVCIVYFFLYLFCICVFHKSGRDIFEMYFRIAFHFADVSFYILGGLRGRLEGAWALGPRDPRAPQGP